MDMFTSRGPRTIAKLICKSNNYGLRQVYVTCVVNGVKLYLYIYTHLANVWGKCQYSIHWSQWAMCSWDITILTNMFCRCNCQQQPQQQQQQQQQQPQPQPQQQQQTKEIKKKQRNKEAKKQRNTETKKQTKKTNKTKQNKTKQTNRQTDKCTHLDTPRGEKVKWDQMRSCHDVMSCRRGWFLA